MKNIFKFFSSKHLLASLFIFMLLILGISAITTINKDLYPRVKLNDVYITTTYPGASPEDVEMNVTNKIEKKIRSVHGIEKFTSRSVENMSHITVRIEDELSNDKVSETIQNIRDAVALIDDFPKQVKGRPVILRSNTGTLIPVIGLGLYGGGKVSYVDLRKYSRILEKKIRNIPDVAAVKRIGYLNREIFIEVIPEKMKYYHLSNDDISEAIASRNIRGTAGTIETAAGNSNVITLSQFADPNEVKEVIIRSVFNARPIKVKDVAIVKDSFSKKQVYTKINGKEVIYFDILKKERSDIIKTVDQIKELIKDEEKYLPEGMQILYTNDFSRYVRASFDVVINNGIMGFLLVLITLTLFLNFRVSFWVAMGIPVSLLATIALLPRFDVSLDVITLAAMILILGMIVDDAIVISEKIYQRWEAGETPLMAAVHGLNDVFWPVITTIVSTLLAFFPMFLIPGDDGKFIKVIPLTISLALIVSLAEAIISLPAHISHGLKKSKRKSQKGIEKGKAFFDRFQNKFEKLLRKLLAWRYLLVLIFVGFLVTSIWYATTYMKLDLFPTKGAEEFVIHLETPVGTPLTKTNELVSKVEERIDQLPRGEWTSYMTNIGNPEGMLIQDNIASIRVNLTPYSNRDRVADEITAQLREETAAIEGFSKLIFDVAETGPNPQKPIHLNIVGINDSQRKKLADEVILFLKGINGVREIERNDLLGKKQLQVVLNHEKLKRLGLNEADISANLRTIVNGYEITKVQYGEEEVKFKLRFPASIRNNKEKMLELKVPNEHGQLIYLKKFSTLKQLPGQSDFFHYNGDRAVTVMANVDKTIITPENVMAQIQSEFNLSRDYPDLRFVIEGSSKKTTESVDNLSQAFFIAIIGIYFLLVLLFNSLKQPFLVLSAIPFGISGVIFTFAAHNEPFSFMGLLGIIGLSGVVVNASIVMVDHLNNLVNKRRRSTILNEIAAGASQRLRAIVLTTITTSAGLLPLAYGIGGSDPMNAPMVLGMGWGLIFSTLLTLILVPCLYFIDLDLERLFRKIKVSIKYYLRNRKRRVKVKKKKKLVQETKSKNNLKN